MRRCFVAAFFLPFTLVGQPDLLMREYNRGWRLLGQGKPDDALPIFKEILIKDPSFYRATNGAAEAFHYKNDATGAGRFFDELRARDGASAAYLLYGYGLVQVERQDYQKALVSFRQCVTQLPAWPACYTGLVAGVANPQDIAPMLGVIRRFIASDPKNAAAQFGLGEIYRRLGRFPEAFAAYQEAIANSNCSYSQSGEKPL